MADTKQITRQWRLLNSLASRRNGATVTELAEAFGVSLKTIRRDLDQLRLVGFLAEPEQEAHLRQRWRVDDATSIPTRHFTLEEAAALYLGREFLGPLAGTVFWQGSQSAFEKIRASFGDLALEYLEKLARIMYRSRFGHSDYAEHAQIIDDLMVSIEDRKITIILYQSLRATEPVEHEVHPYGIAYHKQALYLVAFSSDNREIRHYKINRISEVDNSGPPFNEPKHFELDAYFADAFGVYLDGGRKQKAVVRFGRPVARFLREYEWHPSQKLTPQKDGSILFEVEVASFVELKSFIQSFGKHAVVLEPEDLRTEIRDECLATLEAYEKMEADV